MSLLTSIVDLECIRVDPGKGRFDPRSKSTEIEAVAHSIAKLEGLVRIPAVRSLGIDEYELVDGYLEYYAYEAARKLNPNLPDRITVFVMKPSNEQAILEQLEVYRQIAQIEQPSTKTQDETDENLALRFSNLESRIDSGFMVELRSLKSELMTLITALSKEMREAISSLEAKLENLPVRITAPSEEMREATPNKLNLLSASENEIRDALIEAGIKEKYAEATLKAIEYWKTSGRKLTWANLKQSTTGKKHDYKIKDFGVNTFNKLKDIAEIK
jgi:hypothetical protein